MEVEFTTELTYYTSQARARKIIKGKRTKRQRPCSPNRLIDTFTPDHSPVMSSEEDEDMANCLIMLAQSESPIKESESESDPIRQKTDKLTSRRFTEIIAATRGGGENEKPGLYVYECKTCNRTFPSFQALGGHRASHKKPKQLNMEEKKSSSVSVQYSSDEEENNQHKRVVVDDKENTLRMITNNNVVKSSTSLLGFVQTGLTNNKIKVHECSICGSVFSSGQALGGHMRKHRPIGPSISRLTDSVMEKSQGGSTRGTLSLDLNFPPPEVVDDVVQSKFKFTNSSSQQHMVLSSPALVDCHY